MLLDEKLLFLTIKLFVSYHVLAETVQTRLYTLTDCVVPALFLVTVVLIVSIISK